MLVIIGVLVVKEMGLCLGGGGMCIEEVVDPVMDHMIDFFLLIDHALRGVHSGHGVDLVELLLQTPWIICFGSWDEGGESSSHVIIIQEIVLLSLERPCQRIESA